MKPNRFSLLTTASKLMPLLNEGIVKDSLQGIADWLDAASAATGLPGGCYRTAIFHEGGEITWMFPRSNTSELISAWLDLGDLLGEKRYHEKAVAYAERMVSDPERGFYFGEREEAHGMAWYWRDDGTYTGGYSMRAPESLIRLHAISGDSRLLVTCERIGRTFLKRQLPSGMVSMVGWCPKRGWVLQDMVGSRYFYPVATFATLFKLTSDSAYQTAYERAMDALLRAQQPNGSFFQHYDPATLEVKDRSIKLHFFAYIFNALAEAYSIFQDERLVECGKRMAEYLAGIFYYRQQLPYCADAVYPTDIAEADSAVQDNANGLFWLHQVTGDALYLDMAAKLWMQAWSAQLVHPGRPGWHGALVRANNPELGNGMASGLEGTHLEYEPSRLARCEVWFVVNHVFASRRLLEVVGKNRESAACPD